MHVCTYIQYAFLTISQVRCVAGSRIGEQHGAWTFPTRQQTYSCSGLLNVTSPFTLNHNVPGFLMITDYKSLPSKVLPTALQPQIKTLTRTWEL